MKLNRVKVIDALTVVKGDLAAAAALMMKGQRKKQLAEAKTHMDDAIEHYQSLKDSDDDMYVPSDVRRLREKIEAIEKYLLLVGMSNDEDVEAGSLGKLRDLL